MSDKEPATIKPPYVAYKTFHNFIASLRESGVPDRIDRSVLPGLSGANQSFLLVALRFLGFINEAGAPTADFVKLVKEPANEKATLSKVTKAAYHTIFGGGFNVEAGTEAQFLDRFRIYDLSGDTVRKCLSFFVLLCSAAGIKLSPHLKGTRGTSTSGGVRRAYRRRKVEDEQPSELTSKRDGNTIQELLLQKFPSFDPKWDPETQKKWFDSFEKFMKAATPPEAAA